MSAISKIDTMPIEEIKRQGEAARLEMQLLDLEERRGSLVSVQAVKNSLANLAINFNTILNNMSSKSAPSLARAKTAAKCKQILDTDIKQVVSSLNNIDVNAIAKKSLDQSASQKHRDRQRRTAKN